MSETIENEDHEPNVAASFLRGAGVALALPWLESLPLLAQDGAVSVAANANKPPIRFAHIFFSNGVEPAHWWAKGDGEAMEFGPGAQPLAPIREDLIFLRGLWPSKAFVSMALTWENEFALRRDGQSGPEEIRVGTSFDQVLAQRIGNQTAAPSLALGIEPNELRRKTASR